MKKRHLISLASLALLLSACVVPSVNPFYLEKNVVSDARLLGEWQPTEKDDNTDSWKFEKAEGKSFTLTITEDEGKSGAFTAHLFKLKNEYFFDLIPKGCDFSSNQTDLVAASMFPGHLLMRVSQMEPTLKVAFYNVEWLDEYLEKNPKTLAHRRQDKQLLLTASTAELQRFVIKHMDGEEMFSDFGELTRKPGTAPGTRQ